MEQRKVRASWGSLVALLWMALAAILIVGCRSPKEPGFAEISDLPGTPIGVGSTPQTVSNSAAIASPSPSVNSGGTHFSATNHAAANGSYSNDIIRVGELLEIRFSDTPQPIPPIQDRVRDDGKITLLYTQAFSVVGKMIGEFEKEIRERYVPAYFAQMTATVIPLERQKRYYVDGEVRVPSEKLYVGRITVTQAIAGCGGFTDFAKKTAVRLIRENGTMEIINCKKAITNPRLDREVFPGDRIYIPRSLTGFGFFPEVSERSNDST